MTSEAGPARVSTNKQIPRLRFGFTAGSRRRSHKQLVENLRNGFDTSPTNWIVTRTHIPSYVVDVEIDGYAYSIKLDRDHYKAGLWIVSVVPLVDAGLFYLKTCAPVPDAFIPGLQVLCKRAHEIIVNVPNVHEPYWYFEWSDYRSQSVWTPNALPWEA